MFAFYVHGGQRTNFRSQVFPSMIWVLGIKLRPSGVVVGTSWPSYSILKTNQKKRKPSNLLHLHFLHVLIPPLSYPIHPFPFTQFSPFLSTIFIMQIKQKCYHFYTQSCSKPGCPENAKLKQNKRHEVKGVEGEIRAVSGVYPACARVLATCGANLPPLILGVRACQYVPASRLGRQTEFQEALISVSRKLKAHQGCQKDLLVHEFKPERLTLPLWQPSWIQELCCSLR